MAYTQGDGNYLGHSSNAETRDDVHHLEQNFSKQAEGNMQANLTMARENELSAPPPSLSFTEMVDLDMEMILLNASVLALTRELVIRGLPLKLAELYVLENVPTIPIHTSSRVHRNEVSTHRAICKGCGKLLPRDFSRNRRPVGNHKCGQPTARNFQKRLENSGWHQLFKDLDRNGWNVGLGPHKEVDSKRYLGPELFDAIQSLKNGVKNSTADSTSSLPLDPRRSPSNMVPAKSIESPANNNKVPIAGVISSNQRRKAMRAEAIRRRTEAKPKGKDMDENLALAIDRARAVVRKQKEMAQINETTEFIVLQQIAPKQVLSTFGVNGLRRQIPRCDAPQQVLPAFDMHSLMGQIDSISFSPLQQEATEEDLVT